MLLVHSWPPQCSIFAWLPCRTPEISLGMSRLLASSRRAAHRWPGRSASLASRRSRRWEVLNSMCDGGTLGGLSAGPGCKFSLGFHLAGSKTASSSNDVGAFLSQSHVCAQDTVALLARRPRRPLRRGPRRLKSRATSSLVCLAASDTASRLLSRPENICGHIWPALATILSS